MSAPCAGRVRSIGAAALMTLVVFNMVSNVAVADPATAARVWHGQPRQGAPAVAPPALPIRNAATDLAETLAVEARELLVESQRMQAEAALGLAARGRLRSIAAFLLQSGAARPWEESATVVAGIRLAGILRRCDGLIEDALDARSARDGRPLEDDEARAAVAAVAGIARLDLDRVRDAGRNSGALPEAQLAAALTEALAETLAPLVTLAGIVEGLPLPDPWPVLPPDSADVTTRAEADAEAMRLAAALVPDAVRERVLKALEAVRAKPEEDRSQVLGATRLVAWLSSPDSAIAGQSGQALDRILLAVDDLAAADANAEAEARDRLAGLTTLVGAARALVSAASETDSEADERSQFQKAAAALLAGELGADVARRTPNAARILAALAARAPKAGRQADSGARGSDRPDLHEALRRLDREAEDARKTLPTAILALASVVPEGGEVDQKAEHGLGSSIDRMLRIEADRARIVRLGQVIESMRRIDPKTARDVVAVARRLARELGDPRRRTGAEAAIDAIERIGGISFPLPYEDELRRRGDAALERTGGQAARLVEEAAAARSAWIAAVATGEVEGPAGARLERIGRLFACLRDLDGVDVPITREAGDRLATWGAWASRRAALAPAAADPLARATLASRSLLGGRGVEAERVFERDVASLERSIPLVALAARLERTLGPLLVATPDSTSALLAPIVRRPPVDAALVELWPQLRKIDRALFEMEFARRNGDRTRLDALSGFVADVAREALGSF